jgi:hypothetical protein
MNHNSSSLMPMLWSGGSSPDELPQPIKQKIDAEKCLVSILWLVHGIFSLLDVPQGTAHNTTFFTDAVIPNLIENGSVTDS